VISSPHLPDGLRFHLNLTSTSHPEPNRSSDFLHSFL